MKNNTQCSTFNSQLQKGWEYGTLADAVNKGSSNISLNKVKDDDGKYKLFSAKGYNKNISFFHQEKEYLAIIKDGAGIGRVSKHPAKSSVVATMQYLIPKGGFDIGFVQYFLNGIDFEKHRQGSTIPHVYFKDYKSEPFPLLSLTQQKQIVAILDKAFAAIDTAKANAKQNLQNAKELFESYLQNVFENKGDDWVEEKWDDILEIRSGRNQKAVLDPNGAYPILGSAGKIMGYANNYLCEENTTIIGRKGTINNPLFITTKFWNVDTAFGLHAGEKLTSKFLYYFCRSFDFTEMDKGSGRPSLVKTDLLLIKMSFPSVLVQEQILKGIDVVQAETKKLEVIYTQKLADLEEMKKSVLQKAFSGQLNIKN